VSFPRCRHCKSPVNPDRFPRCIGCGAELSDVLPPSPRKRPNVLQEATKDSGNAFAVLTIIGGLGILGFLVSIASGYLMILTGVMALTGLGAWIHRLLHGSKDSTGPSCLRMLVALMLCGVALFFGLWILLGFACITGGGRFD